MTMTKDSFIAPLSVTADGMTIRCYQLGDGQRCARRWLILRAPEALDAVAAREDTPEAAEVRSRRFMGMYLQNDDYVLSIWLGDQLIGGTGFHLRGAAIDTGNAEIGMWIRGSYAGQGLGSHALKLMLRWGFTEWGWERLVWQCDTRNHASARVAQKNGMQLEATLRSDMRDVEGRRRDTYIFGMLRDEWAEC